MIQKLCAEHATERLWVIQIDNWFDHKWLGFSGKGVVDFRFPEYMHRFDGALEEFYQDGLTFPPFTPNRVQGQWSFQSNGNELVEAPLVMLPHPSERRRSSTNLQRRVENFGVPALFVWFSGNTMTNDRASVMVYDTRSLRPAHWFAAFARRTGWSLLATKGVARKYVLGLLNAV
jgi:hypothetical protein